MRFDLTKFYREHPPEKPDLTWPEMRLDHESLLELVELFEVKTILEIGTWRGYTALLLCSHPGIEAVHAIDICDGMHVPYRHRDHPLHPPEFYGIRARGSPKYSLEFCDSLQRKPKPGEKYDMVFVDGAHDYEHAAADTRLAAQLATELIVWHDYPHELGVRRAVEESGMSVSKIVRGSLVAYSAVIKRAISNERSYR